MGRGKKGENHMENREDHTEGKDSKLENDS